MPDLSDAICASCREVSHWATTSSSCKMHKSSVQDLVFAGHAPATRCGDVLFKQRRRVLLTCSVLMMCLSAKRSSEARSLLRPPTGNTSGTAVAVVMTR